MNELRPRIIGAIIYVLLLLSAAYFGGYVQWTIYLGLTGVMCYELSKMTTQFIVFSLLSFFIVAAIPWTFTYLSAEDLQNLMIIECVALVALYLLFPSPQKKGSSLMMLLFPFFYIGLTISIFLLANKNFSDYSYKPVVILFAIMWMNDTGAYFTGKALGKTKMAPKISPNKTWEGFAGGVLAAMIMVPLVIYGLGYTFQGVWIIIIGFIAVMGTVGDLMESKLKRYFGIKDSGNFFPGHGGVLDRMDSLLFTIPFYFLCLELSHLI